jgi:hypothetical protein
MWNMYENDRKLIDMRGESFCFVLIPSVRAGHLQSDPNNNYEHELLGPYLCIT